MGFKDYCKNINGNTNSNLNDGNTKRVEELYDKYKDKNEDELFCELIKNVEQQKEDGTFNFDALQQMVNNVLPFLTNEQKQKVNMLLDKIK